MPPGRYEVTAYTQMPPRSAGPDAAASFRFLWAREDLTVAGDVSGLTLSLRPGVRFAGRVRFEGATGADLPDPTALRIQLNDPFRAAPEGIGPVAFIALATTNATVEPDGTFDMDGVLPDEYTVNVAPAPEGWWLRSVVVDGIDVLDDGLQLGEYSVTEATVTFTRQPAGLSGTMQSADGQPAPDYYVIVFPEDRSLWRPGARRIQSTRPADNGRYAFENLPPGTYRVAALTDVEPDEWQRPEFLETVLAASVPVTIGEGEQRDLDLRVSRGSNGPKGTNGTKGERNALSPDRFFSFRVPAN